MEGLCAQDLFNSGFKSCIQNLKAKHFKKYEAFESKLVAQFVYKTTQKPAD